ncbi:stalk domain-containing protein [Anoxynatronum sibiricum]|uniref:Stalk domain-containing protein n=1 Tax=Anoxynatronum sibiricum TaxID=210623 RepID=A0ABU9VVX6_9CLOT
MKRQLGSNMGKRQVALILAIIMLLSLTVPAAAATGEAMKPQGTVAFIIDQQGYAIDGQWQPADVAPYIQDGRTMVPVRYVAAALGAHVSWNEASQQVTVNHGDDTIVMTIGSHQLMKNGQQAMVMDAVPVIVPPGRTMIPVSRVAEVLGVPFSWDEASRTAYFMPHTQKDDTTARVFDQPGVFGPEEGTETLQGNVLITADGVTLQNYVITGDLTIDEGVGEGDVSLENVEIQGDVHVYGGGENSILFNNVDVAGALVVNKVNGAIRILATGNTNIAVTVLESGAILVERALTGGGFETVEIAADIAAGQAIVIEGNVSRLNNQAANLDLTINGTVGALASTGDLTIKGKVTVTRTVTSGGNQFDLKTPDAAPRQSTTRDNTGSRDSSGDSSGGSSGGSTTVAVNSVAIPQGNISLIMGASQSLTAEVLPSNATNKQVTWTSSSPAVATINASGQVTGVSPGTATITVRTVSGGKTASIVVTVTAKPAISLNFSSFGNANKGDAFESESNAAAIWSNRDAYQLKNISLDVQPNATVTTFVYDQGAKASGQPFPVVVSVQAGGQALQPTSETSKSTNGQAFPFGSLLKGSQVSESFLVYLDMNRAEHNLEVTDPRYTTASTTIQWVPAGGQVVESVEAITGQLTVGETLTAGSVKSNGNTVTNGFDYQWYRASTVTGNYQAISGATTSQYTLVEADAGKFFKVRATGDGTQLYGAAATAAYGPVASMVDTEAVFTAIEAAYLGSNASTYVTQSLNLMTTLPAFSGVTISWQSSDPGVVNPQTGGITRHSQDDKPVTLTATVNGALSREWHVVVLSQGMENVGQTGSDNRFAPGYPRAFISNGTIHVEAKTTTPVKAYMLVNVINGHIPSSVEGVLGGYGGAAGAQIHVNSWPYAELEANQLLSFDTGVSITRTRREARVEFVLTNMDNSNRGGLVTILFDQQTMEAIDQQGPELMGIKRNEAGSKLHLYFNEDITTNGLSTAHFNLSSGTVTGIDGFTNYGDQHHVGSVVVLSVSSLGSNATLSYTGSAIKDTSLNQNPALTFSNQPITSAATTIQDVIVGNDGKSVMVKMEGGMSFNYSDPVAWLTKNDFTFETTQGDKKPATMSYSYNEDWIDYRLTFAEPVAVDSSSRMRVEMNKPGLRDYAYDGYGAALVNDVTQNLRSLSTSPTSVEYTNSNKVIKINFDSAMQIDRATFADNFTLKIGGDEYRLRGQLVNTNSSNRSIVQINLTRDANDGYGAKLATLLDATPGNVQIKYDTIHGDGRNQMRDLGGALIPSFSYQSVTFLP